MIDDRQAVHVLQIVIRISETDVRWIRAVHGGHEPAPPAPSFESPLARAMNSFIESLPLDDFTGPTDPTHPPPAEASDQPSQASE